MILLDIRYRIEEWYKHNKEIKSMKRLERLSNLYGEEVKAMVALCAWYRIEVRDKHKKYITYWKRWYNMQYKKANYIIDLVASYFDLKRVEILRPFSNNEKADKITLARQIAMYLCKEETGLFLEDEMRMFFRTPVNMPIIIEDFEQDVINEDKQVKLIVEKLRSKIREYQEEIYEAIMKKNKRESKKIEKQLKEVKRIIRKTVKTGRKKRQVQDMKQVDSND